VNKYLQCVVTFIVAIQLVGCGPVKMPNVATYTISSLHDIAVPARSRTSRSIVVAMPEAAPGYGSSKMLYVNIPYKLKAFTRHAWVAPPAEMLLPLLAQRLRAKGYFKAVLTPPFVGQADYRLETQLLVLQQEFLEPDSELHMVLQVTLSNATNGKVLASRRFAMMEKASENNPYGGVMAANRVAARLTQQIANFVVANAR